MTTDKVKAPPVSSGRKIILDLCGGTGAWSKPFWESGNFEVHNITLPRYNILATKFDDDIIVFRKDTNDNYRTKIKVKDVYGILAAPPCTMFSDARTNAKTPRDLEGGMKLVHKCLEVIWYCQYWTKTDQQKYPPLKFWALENPWYGRLKWFLGNPKFEFSPWEFSDAYKKRTAIWGYFNEPTKTVTDINQVMTQQQQFHKTNSQKLPKFDYMKSKDIHPEMFGKLNRQARRSITPAGFAKAFYEANL
jgi:hypothetical protein